MFYSVATRPVRTFQNQSAQSANIGALERFLSEATSEGASQANLSHGNTGSAKSAVIEDLETAYTLQLDVPGIAKEQLDIGIEGDVVRVSSKVEATRSVKAAWRFPLEIDVANSTAKLENGVLTLSLGKKIPVSNVAQLTIN